MENAVPEKRGCACKGIGKGAYRALPEGFTTIIKGEGLEWEPGIQEV